MELRQENISAVVFGIRLILCLSLKHLTGFNQQIRNSNIRHLELALQSEQTQIMYISRFT